MSDLTPEQIRDYYKPGAVIEVCLEEWERMKQSIDVLLTALTERTKELEQHKTLCDVAADRIHRLADKIDELIDDRDRLSARVTELEGEQVERESLIRQCVNSLIALTKHAGHDPRCAFSGCTCGKVSRFNDALLAANRLLREVSLIATLDSHESG